jgi:hypothetical protein
MPRTPDAQSRRSPATSPAQYLAGADWPPEPRIAGIVAPQLLTSSAFRLEAEADRPASGQAAESAVRSVSASGHQQRPVPKSADILGHLPTSDAHRRHRSTMGIWLYQARCRAHDLGRRPPHRTQEVAGSSPASSTSRSPRLSVVSRDGSTWDSAGHTRSLHARSSSRGVHRVLPTQRPCPSGPWSYMHPVG